MAEALAKWAIKVRPELNKVDTNINKFKTEIFMRDPIRAIILKDDYFLSPADGLILYQKKVKPHQEVVEIKGQNYTLKDIMEDQDFEYECLVIGIFMTFFDVHINRMPTNGVLRWQILPPIKSFNRPMVAVENDLIDDTLRRMYSNMEYMKDNARCINTINNPNIDYEYYITQIADDVEDMFLPFTHDTRTWCDQGQRFSFIRWGSQVELVLPLDPRFNFRTVWPNLYHVEAGIDPLVKVERK